MEHENWSSVQSLESLQCFAFSLEWRAVAYRHREPALVKYPTRKPKACEGEGLYHGRENVQEHRLGQGPTDVRKPVTVVVGVHSLEDSIDRRAVRFPAVPWCEDVQQTGVAEIDDEHTVLDELCLKSHRGVPYSLGQPDEDLPAAEVDADDEVPNVLRDHAPGVGEWSEVGAVVGTAHIDLLLAVGSLDAILVISILI